LEKIQYLLVCVPERISIQDLVEYHTNRLSLREDSHLVWCKEYLFEYEEEWSVDKPYIHYVIMVNYVPLEDYKRYALVDQGEVSFTNTVKTLRGSAVPVLIKKADESHPRTKGILNGIKQKEKKNVHVT
jgi:hypothetical protein